MSRYLGPKWRISRALNFPLLGGKEFSKGKKRRTRPGIYGYKTRIKGSTYNSQIKEKQKIRFLYGLREKQMYNLFKRVKKTKKEDISLLILNELESRVDNLIFRSGLVPSRAFARQWIVHRHFYLEGKRIKTPSLRVKVGQFINFDNSLLNNTMIAESVKKSKINNCSHVSFNEEKIHYLRKLDKNDKEIKEIEKEVDMSLVIGWYNRRI